MNHSTTKRNKKEEQKKLAVRIVCLVLVAALLVTSLLTMFPSLFQQDEGYTMQELIDAGIIYVDEEGNYQFTDAGLEVLTDDSATEEQEEHDHE